MSLRAEAHADDERKKPGEKPVRFSTDVAPLILSPRARGDTAATRSREAIASTLRSVLTPGESGDPSVTPARQPRAELYGCWSR